VEELVPLAVVLAAAAAGVWYFGGPQAVFVVRVRAWEPLVTHGTATPAFLVTVAEVCREFGLQSAEVRGVARGRRISLRFSSNVPPAARQRLRNWWAISGWSAGPAARRPRRR
jgi:hypothetical protein